MEYAPEDLDDEPDDEATPLVETLVQCGISRNDAEAKVNSMMIPGSVTFLEMYGRGGDQR